MKFNHFLLRITGILKRTKLYFFGIMHRIVTATFDLGYDICRLFVLFKD